MLIAAYLLVALGAYLLGSIPTGYLVGKARGIDIRKVGSGNMGATNVFRVLGKGDGSIVLIVDALKGYASCTWLVDLVMHWVTIPVEHIETIRILAGIGAVLGHNYTCWLGFKGGKGVATSAGICFALAPLPAGIALVTWIILFGLTRYVSIASIGAALALPAAVWILGDDLLLKIIMTALGAMVILKHRTNIQRLLNGTENRFGRKAAVQEATE